METLYAFVNFNLACEGFRARPAIDPRRKDQQVSQPMDERLRIDVLAPLALPIGFGILLRKDMLHGLVLGGVFPDLPPGYLVDFLAILRRQPLLIFREEVDNLLCGPPIIDVYFVKCRRYLVMSDVCDLVKLIDYLFQGKITVADLGSETNALA